MCWECKAKDKKIAKRNIPVKKVLYKNNKSPFRGFLYEDGKEYQRELDVHMKWKYDTEKPSGIFIESGLHCYSNKCITKEIHYDREAYICIFCPIFSSISSFLKKHHKVVKGFIPVGSTYYENKNGEIVTEKLILTIPKE
jgi:hypothetical protein